MVVVVAVAFIARARVVFGNVFGGLFLNLTVLIQLVFNLKGLF